MDARRAQPSRDAVVATIAGLLFGLALHLVTAYARDHGPSGDNYSLRGNGAIVLLLLAPLAVLIGEAVYARRRAWLAMALLPLATVAGLFLILGGV